MKYIFELLASKIGFSRIGRIIFSKERKLFISTPNLVVPIKSSLMKEFNFIQEFENHDLFKISKEFFLKIGFLREKFKDNGFIFTYPGSIKEFEEILIKNYKLFSKDNIISLIPFNIPTTSISKDFALKEIKHYLKIADKILKERSDLNFGLSIKIFEYVELLDPYLEFVKQFEHIKIINLIDLFDNLNDFRKILKCIIHIKTELDNNIILMASGRIIPKYYPMLVYLGIDLIDASFLLYLSAENFYDTIEYLLPIYKIKYFPCSCLVCKDALNKVSNDKYSAEKIQLLSLHNLITANNYMKKIKQYLNYEDFRAFVEKSCFDDTRLISMLKVLDKEYFEILKYETPIWQNSNEVKCFGPISYNRPDFKQFRERTIKNFEPEPWTSLIILLPCSAKKPYSKSKTHKIFYKVIRKFPEFPSFQEFILTSPLGCIPRQLENIYPVNSYDISVTGEWDEEEKDITSYMFIKLIEKFNSKIPIICHLDKTYLDIVKGALEKLPHNFAFSEITDNITSRNSLQSLEDLIIEFKNMYNPDINFLKSENYTKTWIRKFIKILDYQFGKGTGINVISDGLKPIRIKYGDQIELIDLKTKEKLGIFKFSTGQIELTILGFEKILKSKELLESNYVIFDGKDIQGNTLFRPGVIDYSLDLIPNNQVVILDKSKKKVLGSGELIVGSNFLKHSKSGRIAKIND
jgi:archaeosine synthase